MKCPDCKGTGKKMGDKAGIFRDNTSCQPCGGTGEVDKIRQLYIDSELLDIDEDDSFVIFTAGYKSCDEENKKLTNALKVCMSALQRETSHMPNYDVTESQMWEIFRVALGEIT